MKEALLYEKTEGKKVKCNLCAHRCKINPGKQGICKVRENIDGTLYTKVYGCTIARHIDPVEKKPLYHFYPGSSAFSIGTPGCNFHCDFCQNCEISQVVDERILQMGHPATPEEIVEEAIQSGSKSIAYTYSEPVIFFEYSYDIARLAHEKGLKNVYVSNGFMTAEMLDMIGPYLDAINIDLKAFKDETYRKLMGGRLEPVLNSLRKVAKTDIWLEVTSLIIPGVNDSPHELHEMAHFVSDELGTDVPWHISRFFPGYKMNDVPPTPMNTLLRAKQAGVDAGLNYIYVGNVPSAANQNTYCPHCNALLIERMGYTILSYNIENGRCPKCKTKIAVVD
ncbi:AmmeMemoRadiSam system radical SAM enzyme [Anaerophaga thermohalophila]|uniref:AmmeMemoRadiSam system radical SAM enzyme n=1 Tax=Anaerophaga thermohalophila TaxID=177400 RepID=UPI000237D37C|nr:AmmeMemoRadiSam system radical SAM enzyme [Anaerophaga thermohalophila]